MTRPSAGEKEYAAKEQARKMLDDSKRQWTESGAEGEWKADLAGIAKATGLSVGQVRGMKGYDASTGGTSTPGAQGANGSGTTVIKVLEDGAGKAPEKPEKPTGGSALDKLNLESDQAQSLRTILKITSGAPGPQVSGVLQAVEEMPELYTKDGMELYSSLQLAGLSNQRAQIATTKWLNRVGATKEALRFSREVRLLAGDLPEGEESNPIADMNRTMKDLMAFQTQQVQLQIQQQQLAQMKEMAGKSKEPEDSNRDRLDHMMDRMEEIKIMQSVFKDEKGTGPVNGQEVAYQEQTEYADVTDKESGQVMRVPVRTVKTPVFKGAATESAPGTNPMLARMTDAYMIKMMADAMKGSGPAGMYAPGTVVEMVPKTENGVVVLDENKQPVMIQKISYLSAPPAAAGSTPADTLNMVVKIAEVLKPAKSEDAAVMTKYFMDQATAAQATSNKLLTDQIAAMQDYDPLGDSLDHLKELQTLGFAGGPNGTAESEKVGLMRLELDKWRIGESNKMQQWMQEQRDLKDGRKESREQMREVTTTLRAAIKDVAGPIATQFGAGLKESMAKGPAPQAPGQAPPQRRTPPTDLSALSDEELAHELGEANRVGRVVSDAKLRMIEEAQRRGMNPGGQSQQSVSVPPVSQVGDQDLGT